MLEIVEKLAEFSVARACGFAMLAILVTIVGSRRRTGRWR